MSAAPPPLSLYVHLPWCVRKCPYCDFNSHRAGSDAPFGKYVDALLLDIDVEAEKAPGRMVESIFLGGGTPSLFSPDAIASVLERCRLSLELTDDCEVTMEANPGTVERGALAGYRDAGVTRLSIGAQSFDDRMLSKLGRIHSANDVRRCFDEALAVDFDSINVDLMFALPEQTLEMLEHDIAALLDLEPPHVSWYQLTLEPNTVFHATPPAGIPDDDLAWEMQLNGQEMPADSGLVQYEVSAFAQPGHQCRHNLNYWTYGDYLAAGAGAHGKLTLKDGEVRRYQKTAHPFQFLESAQGNRDYESRTVVDPTELGFEFMLNALRLTKGVPGSLFEERTGQSLSVLEEALRSALADELIEDPEDGFLRASADGFRLLNDLQARFLP